MAVSFLGSLRVRFLSATVVVCLLSLSWLQAASEQPQDLVTQQLPSNPIRGQKQYWKQPRPPDSTSDVVHSLLSGITGAGGRRGLRARHGTARLRKEKSMGKQWMQLHKQLVDEVVEADSKGGWDVLFLGDSISESWRGTFMGMVWSAFKRIPAVWDEYFGKYNAHVLAVAGDEIAHLMWRMMNGGLPQKHPKVIVLHAGTNDVGGQACARKDTQNTTETRIMDMVKYLRAAYPRTHIVLMSILPKGEGWPNLCTPMIGAINRSLKAFMDRLPNSDFVDAGQLFLKKLEPPKKGWEVNDLLMSDSTHPTEKGMRILARQLEPILERILGSTTPTTS